MSEKPNECEEIDHIWMELANFTPLPLVLRTKEGGISTSNQTLKVQIWMCESCKVLRYFSNS